MNNNKKLGRGLEAIFGGDINEMIEDIEKNTPSSQYIQVAIEEIRPNPYQPRKNFDKEKLEELASSIREHGIFTPLILKRSSAKGYELVAGERRLRAAKIAKLEEVPAIVVDFDDSKMMEIALLENIQREDLNIVEEARAYQNIIERLGYSQEDIAKRFGKSRSHITNILRLLNLPDTVLKLLEDEKITFGHARALVTLDKDSSEEIAKKIVKEGLNVRQAEQLVSSNNSTKPSVSKIKSKNNTTNNYSYVEDVLRNKLDTQVKVQDNSLVIKFANDDELNRILMIMGMIENE